MSEEKTTTNPRAAAQLSGRVTQETLAKFKEIQEAESFETFGQFVESLLMHYYDPVKVNKGNEAEIKRLKAEYDDVLKKYENVLKQYDDLKAEHEQLLSEYNALGQKNSENMRRIDEYRGLEHKMDGHMLVPVSELDMRCLQWLADRENKSRHRDDITPEMFFMFAVKEMIIKGNKFAISSMPDRIIAQIEREIQDGQ